MLYLTEEDHVLMSMNVHIHVLYIHIHVYTLYVLYIYVRGLCVSSLIVCYLLHTHTQLLIDPRSSNEITNCCTSSLARICVFIGMVLVCVYQCCQPIKTPVSIKLKEISINSNIFSITPCKHKNISHEQSCIA